jgi:hypothetical protein
MRPPLPSAGADAAAAPPNHAAPAPAPAPDAEALAAASAPPRVEGGRARSLGDARGWRKEVSSRRRGKRE